MVQIVWVFGNAAVGKETFIRRMVSGENILIVNELGLQDATLHIVEESIEWVAYDPSHPFREKRDTLPRVIAEKARSNTGEVQAFFIKGQFVDLELKRPQETLKLLPNAIHRAIYLDAPPETIFERLKTKPWFKSHFDIERVKKLLRYEIDLLKQLDSGIKLAVVESGDNFDYRIKDTREYISDYV